MSIFFLIGRILRRRDEELDPCSRINLAKLSPEELAEKLPALLLKQTEAERKYAAKTWWQRWIWDPTTNDFQK